MNLRLKLYILGVILFSTVLSANAGMIKVEGFSTPQKFANKISQPLNLIFAAEGKWKILIENLDGKILNIDNPIYDGWYSLDDSPKQLMTG